MNPHVRLAALGDASQVQAVYAPLVRDTAVSFELDPPSIEEMQRRIAATIEVFPWLVAECHQSVVGYAYAGPFRSRPAYQWTAEVTVYVHGDHRGKGVGRALYVPLLDCLRVLGFRTALGVIALPNPPSVKLHESLGFRRIGVFPAVGYKLGRWHDTGWWVRELAALPDPPPRPRTVREAAGSSEFRQALAADPASRAGSVQG